MVRHWVGPKTFSRTVRREPQCGHGTRGSSSMSVDASPGRAARSRRPRGRRGPTGLMRSLVHGTSKVADDLDRAPEGREAGRDRRLDQLERRAADEGRQDLDPDRAVRGRDLDAMDDPEIDDRQHRELRVRDLGEGRADGRLVEPAAAARRADDPGARLARYRSGSRPRSPGRSRVRAADHRELAPQPAERLAVIEPAATRVAGGRRHRQPRGARRSARWPRASDARAPRSRRRGCPASTSAGSSGSGVKTVAASGPSSRQRGEQPVARLAVGPGQPVEPRAGVHQVVALLADELADEVGKRRPRPAGQRLEPDRVGGVVQVAPGDRHRPVAPAVVEQAAVAVLVGLAVVGERVRRPCRSARPAGRTAPPRGPARPARASSSPRPPRGAARSPSTPNRRSR